MKTIRSLLSMFVLIVFLAVNAHARFMENLQMKQLMERSQLVFVGEVKSIHPSGITTKLTYPTWEKVVFEWLKVDVAVIEPIKGTEKGQVVHTMMLSVRGHPLMINQPGMIEPEQGQKLLLCLLPTNLRQVYASVTAPFDDNEAIFPLDHKFWTNSTYYKDGKKVAFAEQNDKNRAIWDLTDEKGDINRTEAEFLRKKYETEIAVQPPKDEIIHLTWKTQTNANGWQRNVPTDTNNPGKTYGPITKPGR